MTEREFSGPCQVPITERLLSVPKDAHLQLDTPNALGCMDTRHIAIGVMCHEAAAEMRRLETIARAAKEFIDGYEDQDSVAEQMGRAALRAALGETP